MESPEDEQLSDENLAFLHELGSHIRLSELPDEIVVTQTIVDIIYGLSQLGHELTVGEIAEVLAIALVRLGGFHRLGEC